MTRILFFSGSSKKGSVNTRLAPAAAELVRRAFGTSVIATVIDLADFDMPTYNGPIGETGQLPENGRRLARILSENDAVFIGSDEYTGAYSTLFRNIIWWLTFGEGGCGTGLKNKTVVLCGMSLRGVGGLRGHPALHQFLTSVGASVISQQISLGTSATAFNSKGRFLPGVEKQLLEGSIGKLIQSSN